MKLVQITTTMVVVRAGQALLRNNGIRTGLLRNNGIRTGLLRNNGIRAGLLRNNGIPRGKNPHGNRSGQQKYLVAGTTGNIGHTYLLPVENRQGQEAETVRAPMAGGGRGNVVDHPARSRLLTKVYVRRQ